MSVGVLITSIAPRIEWRQRSVQSVLDQTVLPDQLNVVIDHHRDGAIATRNRGLFSMHTNWTVLIDDDDYLLPNHIEEMTKAAEESDADFLYSVPDGGPTLRYREPFDANALRAGNYIHTGGVMFRTKMARDVGGFENAPGTIFEDYGLWLKLLGVGAQFCRVPVVTWHWNHGQHSTQGQSNRW